MKSLLTPFFVALSLLLSSCGDSPESVTEEMMEKMEEMTAIFKELNEGGDIEDAKADLEDLKAEMKELGEKMKEMEKDLSEEDKKALAEKYEEEMKTITNNFVSESMKLASKGNKEIKEMMEAIFEDMN